MNELALFIGGGGGALGSQLVGHRIVCAVEIDAYCREIIMRRQEEGCLYAFPMWDDIRTFDGEPWRGCVDVVTAGFPCQPFSLEGKRNYETSDNNLWPETARVISEVAPQYVLLENVRGVCKYLPVVIRDLRRIGYTVERPAIVAAGSAGALHIRERVWVLAYAERERWERERDKLSAPARTWLQTWVEFEGLVSHVLKSCVPSRSGRGIHDAVARRVDRLRAVGNGQVPAVAAKAWHVLCQRIGPKKG